MAKTKRLYILATCFLSGAAAILSFVTLGTQEWVIADALSPDGQDRGDNMKSGLFGGVFYSRTSVVGDILLTTICNFELNICAFLCGDNMGNDLELLYNKANVSMNCQTVSLTAVNVDYHKYSLRAENTAGERIFINAGIWICTIIFLIISGVMGLFSAALSVWNTATNPYQMYFSIFGLYIYNGIASFSILLSLILWGAMFETNLSESVPTYQTLRGEFTTDGHASLGYSYWLNLLSFFLYLSSVSLLYIRNYLISREPKKNVPIEDSADPVIYLY